MLLAFSFPFPKFGAYVFSRLVRCHASPFDDDAEKLDLRPTCTMTRPRSCILLTLVVSRVVTRSAAECKMLTGYSYYREQRPETSRDIGVDCRDFFKKNVLVSTSRLIQSCVVTLNLKVDMRIRNRGNTEFVLASSPRALITFARFVY